MIRRYLRLSVPLPDHRSNLEKRALCGAQTVAATWKKGALSGAQTSRHPGKGAFFVAPEAVRAS